MIDRISAGNATTGKFSAPTSMAKCGMSKFASVGTPITTIANANPNFHRISFATSTSRMPEGFL
ncbi:MAG TPA: hypothetical protein VKU01_30435 [Bryobacteraceae bacterium]|nr:hypothetical protein [Bryobacteraceae bacterium]